MILLNCWMKLCICGAVKPCEHKNLEYTDNGDDATHKVTCRDCEQVQKPSAPHEYGVDNKCVFCGACEHMDRKYTDNHDDATHRIDCEDCGKSIAETMPHLYDENGRCILCGAERPCMHEGNHVVDNGNHTHSWICDDCDATVDGPDPCVYENGVCIVCGSRQQTNPGLDDVPKTGSFFLEWLYRLFF